MSETKTNTTVEQVSADDLDNLLGMPGAGVANMSPTSDPVPTPDPVEPDKPTFFQKDKVDMTFLDKNDPDPEPNPTPDPTDPNPDPVDPKPDPVDPTSFENLVDDLDKDKDDASKGGRPTLDKGGMAQLAKALIEDKVILPFDEEKALDDYTMDDYKELFKVNFQERERAVKESTPKEFFQSLPNELQYAAKYVADGGQDLKGLFKALAASEEAKSFSIETEQGQEAVVRQYLQASNFGDESEIQEEIDSWKDLEKLEDRAKKFKPKLDAMQEQIVQRKIVEQEGKRKQQERASLQYADSIYGVLEKGELNGLKLNQKTQSMLYSGLIQPNYPSVSGQNTNLFGHLIEKHQFVEPNHGLIAEALWLLADPDGYRAEIAKGTKNEVVAETTRTLKTEQSNKNAGTGNEPEPGEGARQQQRQTIKRPDNNFFKR
jgi:hypothetical protein